MEMKIPCMFDTLEDTSSLQSHCIHCGHTLKEHLLELLTFINKKQIKSSGSITDEINFPGVELDK